MIVTYLLGSNSLPSQEREILRERMKKTVCQKKRAGAEAPTQPYSDVVICT